MLAAHLRERLLQNVIPYGEASRSVAMDIASLHKITPELSGVR